MNDAALILFTLPPEAEGARKRLGGEARTRRIFAALIAHLQSVCAEVQGLDLIIASTASSPTPGGGLHLPQRGRHFGESLRLAFDDAFALGYRRVLAVGNDTPEISPRYLRRALGRLTDSGSRDTAVLGPTRDGGYGLLGLARPSAAPFRGIRFGGSDVAAATCRRLSADGFVVTRLQMLEDIDDAGSLQRVLRRLARRTPSSLLARLLRRLRHLLGPAESVGQPDRRPTAVERLAGPRPLRGPPVAA